MLFKFYFKRARIVPMSVELGPGLGVHRWEEEQNAYSKDAFFYDLDKAKAYAQLHSPIILLWEDCSTHGYHNAIAGTQSAWLVFVITVEKGVINPKAPMPMPADSDFLSTARDPD